MTSHTSRTPRPSTLATLPILPGYPDGLVRRWRPAPLSPIACPAPPVYGVPSPNAFFLPDPRGTGPDTIRHGTDQTLYRALLLQSSKSPNAQDAFIADDRHNEQTTGMPQIRGIRIDIERPYADTQPETDAIDKPDATFCDISCLETPPFRDEPFCPLPDPVADIRISLNRHCNAEGNHVQLFTDVAIPEESRTLRHRPPIVVLNNRISPDTLAEMLIQARFAPICESSFPDPQTQLRHFHLAALHFATRIVYGDTAAAEAVLQSLFTDSLNWILPPDYRVTVSLQKNLPPTITFHQPWTSPGPAETPA